MCHGWRFCIAAMVEMVFGYTASVTVSIGEYCFCRLSLLIQPPDRLLFAIPEKMEKVKKHRKSANHPVLQSEILNTMAGCEEGYSNGGGGKTISVCASLSDGRDSNSRRVVVEYLRGKDDTCYHEFQHHMNKIVSHNTWNSSHHNLRRRIDQVYVGGSVNGNYGKRGPTDVVEVDLKLEYWNCKVCSYGLPYV
ncbi:hypothetical protein M8C21_022134 [Ambrosia artemisiifolia]|uniref:Uncharacterized protein n=1 Tax=Ambrosia artemisiifolia TaxID=4212 RepID=A0AAD5CDQ3_AMBAR|nr:hypothetical protein M8C21_022134 [Ambrosia artemisiifolia]